MPVYFLGVQQRVTAHVKILWARGQQVVAMGREELGEDADTLVPLVKGGVTMAKFRGAMHDTCNTANLVAKKIRVLRDDDGKAM